MAVIGRQQVITLNTGDATYKTSQCLLWLPDDYNSTTIKYALIMANHGKGEGGTDINKLINASPIQIAGRIANGFNPVGVKNGKTYKYIVFTPQCPIAYSWSKPHFANFLSQLKTQYRIDETAVFITGLSSGVAGEWSALSDDAFAAQIKAVGAASPLPPDNNNWMDKAAARKIPMWLIACKDSYDYAGMINMYNYYISKGGVAIKTELASGGHTSWNQLYDPNFKDVASGGLNFYDWLIKQATPKSDSSITNPTTPQPTKTTYEIKPGMTGFAPNQYKPGDILHFNVGNYTWFVGSNCNGEKGNPILCTFDKGAIFSNGFGLSDCSYWKFDGGTDMNIVINAASGVPFDFKGKCSGIEINGAVITGGSDWIRFKTEVVDFTDWAHWTKKQDGTIEASFIMDGLKVTNCKFKKASSDGCYIGSTGQKADRVVTIDGIDYKPLPAKIANIQFQNVEMDESGRTGMQVSGLLSGTNYLKNCSIKNSGLGKETFQGASFLIGGNSPADFEIDSNTFDGSYLYAVRTDGGGTIKFTNNTVLNSNTVLGVKSSVENAAVQLDGYQKTKFIVSDNKIDASNNNVSLAIFGDANTVSSDSIVENNQFSGLFQNLTGITFKTSDSTTPTTPTPQVKKIKSITVTYTDGTTDIINN